MADQERKEQSVEEPPDQPPDQPPARNDEGKPATQDQRDQKAVRLARPRRLPPWKVILHNDDTNAIDYVVETVMILTPLKEFEAIQRTLEAHHTGLSLLITTHQERAELLKEQFASRNLQVTIEPA